MRYSKQGLELRLGYRHTLTHLGRFRHIMAVLSKYGLEEAVESFRSRTWLRLTTRKARERIEEPMVSRPQRLRMALEEMGPTFVKFGQMLSGRADLLPPEYLCELSKLQDKVAPMAFRKIEAVLIDELGQKVSDHFSAFDPVALAAGSIAQVHKAVTREGNTVAVKIRKPGVEKVIRAECEILENLAGLVKSLLSPEETIDPVDLVRQLTAAIVKETDLDNERRNMQGFFLNFRNDPTVHIPQVYPQYCSHGVLTMEYIAGVKPTDAEIRRAGLDGKLIARRSADFVLKQVFEYGSFHTDPHPGNLLVMDGNVVAILDFGQVAHLGSANQELLGELVLAIVDQDAERLVHAFQREEMLTERTVVRQLSRDLEALLATYHNLPVREIPFGQMMSQTFDLIRRHRIHPPPEFTLMLKSLMTIESLSSGLNADFKLIELLRPYAARLNLRQIDPSRHLRKMRRTVSEAAELVEELPSDLRAILNKFRRGDFQMHVQHEHLDNLVRTLDKSSNRLSFALIIAALLVASSMLVAQTELVLGWIRLQTLGVIGYCVAAVLGLWLLWSIMRGWRPRKPSPPGLE